MAQSVDKVLHQLSSYRGQRISVIGGSDNRFEGWLKDIFPENQTISVEKVRFCGTESRRPDKHVVARNEIYGFIKLLVPQAKEIFVHVERAPEICMDSAVVETSDAVIPILWATARLGNKEALVIPTVPPPVPITKHVVSDEEALLDIPIALKLLSEATQQEDKPQASFISRAKIRYEGTLKGMDPDTRTVSLCNVRFLGTEDRVLASRGVKPVAPRNETYASVKFQLDQIRNIRINVAMCAEMSEDAAVIVQESSQGMIELDAGCPFPIQPSLLHNIMEQTGQRLDGFIPTEPVQNDSGHTIDEVSSASPPVRNLHQDTEDNLFNGPKPRPTVYKARRNSRALTNGPSSETSVHAGDVAAPSSQEPSSSTTDSSSGPAESHRTSSGSVDGQQSEKGSTARKRSASVTPRNSSSGKAKKGKKHSMTDGRHSVGSSEGESERRPSVQNPMEISDVVRSAMEPNSAGATSADNKMNGSIDHDYGETQHEPDGKIIFDVMWSDKRCACPVPSCNLNYFATSMYTMEQHFFKYHNTEYPNYELRLHCPVCEDHGFQGNIPDLRKHLESKHGWKNGFQHRSSMEMNGSSTEQPPGSGEESAAASDS